MRSNGFYWVRRDGRGWIIGEWRSVDRAWFFTGELHGIQEGVAELLDIGRQIAPLRAPPDADEHTRHLQRRVAFLMSEAAEGKRSRDMAVTFTLRTLSNHFTVDADLDSRAIKLYNLRRGRVSNGAINLLHQRSAEMPPDEALDTWMGETVNDHMEPLKVVWAWMKEAARWDSLTYEMVAKRLAQWPMITITSSEDCRLRKEQRKVPDIILNPAARYEAAEIQIVRPIKL